MAEAFKLKLRGVTFTLRSRVARFPTLWNECTA